MSNYFHPEHRAADTFHFNSLHEKKVRDQETAEEEERVDREQALLHSLHGEGVLYFVQRPDGIVQEGESKVESVAEDHLRLTVKIAFPLSQY